MDVRSQGHSSIAMWHSRPSPIILRQPERKDLIQQHHTLSLLSEHLCYIDQYLLWMCGNKSQYPGGHCREREVDHLLTGPLFMS